MRILVLAQSRSGSTGLTAWLKSEFNEPVLIEPFNPYANSEEELQRHMELVKSDDGLILKFVDNMFLGVKEIESTEWLISRFDKVIGLTREDDEACAFSRLIAHLNNDWKGSVHNAPISEQIIKDNENLMRTYTSHAKKQKEFIKALDIFQITFEEIYEEKNVSRLAEYLEITPAHLDYLFENKNITNNWNF